MNKEQMKLALRVKKHILKEHKSVIMDYFQKTAVFLKGLLGSGARYMASCGTVGCIAGHTCHIADGKWSNKSEDRATELLGLNWLEAKKLFYFSFSEYNSRDYFGAYEKERVALRSCKPGTKAYAKVVAAAIDRCIERNYKENS